MSFRSFFFQTYPGFFLQALPVALTAGAVFWAVRYRKDRTAPTSQKIGASLFVCYITELFCLVGLLHPLGALWWRLLYHEKGWASRLFTFNGRFKLVPDFFFWFDKEKIGNILAFLPFGVLFPYFRAGTSLKMTVLAGFLCSLAVEIVQPSVGRTFDVNDLILNTFGTLLSAAVFFLFRKAFTRKQ